MSDNTTYSAPGLKVVSLGSRGRGVVAERNFKQGEVIAIWRGSIITERKVIALSDSERSQLLQVDEDAFLVTNKALLTADYINHSCEPNCGFTDSTTLVAMREITALVGTAPCTYIYVYKRVAYGVRNGRPAASS